MEQGWGGGARWYKPASRAMGSAAVPAAAALGRQTSVERGRRIVAGDVWRELRRVACGGN